MGLAHQFSPTDVAYVAPQAADSTAVLQRMGAMVDERIYPRMGHTINADELRAADVLLAGDRGI